MAKRYTVTVERGVDKPIRVIAQDEREAIDKAALRVYGRRATWQPDAAAQQGFRSADGTTVYRGGIWKPVKGGGEWLFAPDCRWAVDAGWPA